MSKLVTGCQCAVKAFLMYWQTALVPIMQTSISCNAHSYCAGANEACPVLPTERKISAVSDGKCGLSNKLVFRCTCRANSLTLVCLQAFMGMVNL